MIRMLPAMAALLASSALFLGACGPTTEIYQVTSAQSAALAQPLAGVEVDIEQCKPARGSESGSGARELGFVELGRGCQMPIYWNVPPEKGVSLRRFSLVGGPYSCTVGATPRSIRDIHGTVVGDDLSLVVDMDRIGSPVLAGTAPASPYLGVPEQVELRGRHDGSRDSEMICGLPAQPFLARQH